MFNLLRTEWLKMRRYTAFWLLLGICLLSYPGINYIFLNVFDTVLTQKNGAGQMMAMLLGDPFSFPEVWHTTAFFSSVFIFIPSVLVIMLITNEFSYKTHRQNIIDGWNRNQFMTAKVLDVALITLLLTLALSLTAFVIGIQDSPNPSTNTFDKFYYIGLFALQTFSQLSIAFLIGLILRKSFIALGVFLFYGLILEPSFVGIFKYKWLKNDLGRFFPMEISDRLIPPPTFMVNLDADSYRESLNAIKYHSAYTALVILLTWALAFWIYKKRDL